MAKTHMLVRDHGDCFVGAGIEYPGIIVSGKSVEECSRLFAGSLAYHRQAMRDFGVREKPKVSVVTFDE